MSKHTIYDQQEVAVQIILEAASDGHAMFIDSTEDLDDLINELGDLRKLISKIYQAKTLTRIKKLLIADGWSKAFVENVYKTRSN